MKHSLRIGIIGLMVAAATLALACGGGDNNKDTSKNAATPAATQAAASATRAATTQAAATTAASATSAAAASYTPQKAASSVQLNGAGATFPAPFYTKAFDEYNKFDSNVKVNYQSIGSGGGVKNFTDKTVDFGASDAYLTDEQIKAVGGPDQVTLIPTVLGAIVITWNLPGYNGGLKLTPDTLAGIFLGDIKKWNDPKLKADNAGASLPDADIAVVHRSDGSGTTFNFTSYLALVSSTWKEKVGAGTAVNWPTGIGASGNDGVTGQIKQTPGALGYVELNYAESNKLPTAELQNKAGKFVKGTLQSTAAAAVDPTAVQDNLNANLLNAAGDTAYPIVTMTWLILNRSYGDALKGQAIVNLVWWMTHDGQKLAEPLQYATLPKEVVSKVEAKLKQITAGGKPVIPS